jgi:hypothetical protein
MRGLVWSVVAGLCLAAGGAAAAQTPTYESLMRAPEANQRCLLEQKRAGNQDARKSCDCAVGVALETYPPNEQTALAQMLSLVRNARDDDPALKGKTPAELAQVMTTRIQAAGISLDDLKSANARKPQIEALAQSRCGMKPAQ